MNLLRVLMITSALLFVNQSYASPSYAECEYLRGKGNEIYKCQVQVDKREEKRESEERQRGYQATHLYYYKQVCNEKSRVSNAKSAIEENAIYEKCMREKGN